jgi:hypothetical protein
MAGSTVGVNQQISRADNISPRNLSMGLPEFRVELRRSLADDFKIPADRVHDHG